MIVGANIRSVGVGDLVQPGQDLLHRAPPPRPSPLKGEGAVNPTVASVLFTMVANEVRLRARRVSTLVIFFVTVWLAWSMVVDPAGGQSMIVSKGQRFLYNSEALALGSAVLVSFIAGIAGFYLARGRMREDVLHGVGGLLASTPVSNTLLVLARWAGAVVYLATLMGAVMLTMMVLQMVRGDGPVQPLVFLRTYALLLLPSLMFAASVAILCDAFAPLMGKLGDVLYFMLWVGQFGSMPSSLAKGVDAMPWLSVFDFSGLSAAVIGLQKQLGTTSFSFGGGSFNAALPVLTLGEWWTAEMVAMRLASMVLTMLPLVLAVLLFHRYSPDKVKAGAKKRVSLLAWANDRVRPITRVLVPLLALAARLPRWVGQTLADVVLVLMANPLATVALGVLWLAGIITTQAGLTGMAYIGVAIWGIVICDVAARDWQCGTGALTAVTPGGATRRHVRQLAVIWLLGVLYAAPVLTHWVVTAPFRAAVLTTAVFTLGALAHLLAQTTRNGRTFLALFLFGLYLSTQIKGVPWFDALGTHGFATAHTTTVYFVAGVVALIFGGGWNARISR
ncbi:MAG: hypothetical protein JNM76_16510 [Betaproteobacteria bacterium]|nr:hypothetical protein [Betaproteobacteria bacterium]